MGTAFPVKARAWVGESVEEEREAGRVVGERGIGADSEEPPFGMWAGEVVEDEIEEEEEEAGVDEDDGWRLGGVLRHKLVLLGVGGVGGGRGSIIPFVSGSLSACFLAPVYVYISLPALCTMMYPYTTSIRLMNKIKTEVETQINNSR